MEFTKNVAGHYDLDEVDLERLMIMNDEAPSARRIELFRDFCVEHNLPLAEAARS